MSTAGLSGPIAIWQVGRKFTSDPYRLMLIGKTARGTIRAPDEIELELSRNGYIDGTHEADEWIRTYRTAYWRYTSALIERLFSSIDDGWDRVAFTNLVKCNDSMTIDTTSTQIAENCIRGLRVTWRELELLQPFNVILFTNHHYDDYIHDYTSHFHTTDFTDRAHRVPNGAKQILWWHRECVSKSSGWRFRLLRTSHPERQRKDCFVDRLAKWVEGIST